MPLFFFFAASGRAFPNEVFRAALHPWLEREIGEQKGRMFPREGIGCWHPVFPAGAHDIWLLASAAVKELERCAGAAAPPSLVVYEQIVENGIPSGLSRHVAGD